MTAPDARAPTTPHTCGNPRRIEIVMALSGDDLTRIAAITHRESAHQTARILRALGLTEEKIMTEQQDIDAMVTTIGAAVADIATRNVAIQNAQTALDAEIEALAAQVAAGETVDTTALVAAGQALAEATGQLDTTVEALQADPNVPTTPAPPGE